ncbi:MAG TPA: glycosyltransferase family 4 protein [Gemmatimonadales bacterium]|nr:glycosyltransferase family 4 protein [Gemmatimonadales bacterium]
MRIALLTSAKGWRGSAVSYAKIGQGLIDRGHQTQLITVSPALTARMAAEQLPVTEIAGGNTGPREVKALWRALRAHAAEAVVVDTPRDLRLAALATLFHPAPIVYRYNLNYRTPRNHLADRLYGRRVAACVFQSEFIRNTAGEKEPWVRRVPGYRVPNGYDTVRFAPRPSAGDAFRQKWSIPREAFMVLTSAKLERDKGHTAALIALNRVHQEMAGVIYVICGNGAREEELRRLAAATEVRVCFTGLLDLDELIGGLSAADLVLHPSLHEIFPNAVGEAMACACPVIAADAGGTAELLGRDGSAGVLVPPNDPESLAQETAALLRDADRRARLGAAARYRIEREFTLDRMIDGYEAALHQVIGG